MIPFRTQRLATSVVNRIMDVYDGIQPPAGVGVPAAPSNVSSGDGLEQRLATPPQASDAAPEVADQIALGGLL